MFTASRIFFSHSQIYLIEQPAYIVQTVGLQTTNTAKWSNIRTHKAYHYTIIVQLIYDRLNHLNRNEALTWSSYKINHFLITRNQPSKY